jgi:hypothetical protein
MTACNVEQDLKTVIEKIMSHHREILHLRCHNEQLCNFRWQVPSWQTEIVRMLNVTCDLRWVSHCNRSSGLSCVGDWSFFSLLQPPPSGIWTWLSQAHDTQSVWFLYIVTCWVCIPFCHIFLTSVVFVWVLLTPTCHVFGFLWQIINVDAWIWWTVVYSTAHATSLLHFTSHTKSLLQWDTN